MIKRLPVNVVSLKLVEEELNNTIQIASSRFEGFLGDRNNTSPLQECLKELTQIRGILKLIEMPGVVQLTEEMLAMIEYIIANQGVSDRSLAALSNSFVALPCYMEFCTKRQYALPVLLLEYINDLRVSCKTHLVPESKFAKFNGDLSASLPDFGSAQVNEDIHTLARRLRHMYHVGLLGIITDDATELKARLMLRATKRLLSVAANTRQAELWWLASGVLEAIELKYLSVGLSRKRLLSSIDKYIKAVVLNGAEAFDTQLPQELKAELLFLIALANCSGATNVAIREAYQLPSFELSDNDICRERALMQGPNADTISSMVSVLKEELLSAKEILEIAAQDVITKHTDFEPLNRILGKVADILSVVGLKSTSAILTEQLTRISKWGDGSEDISGKSLLEVADALLYVESTLSQLGSLDLNEEAILQASEITKKELIAKSHLQEAELLVVKEAQAGIAMAKRAISSFVESNYDNVHISNVTVTLNSVRGGLSVLNYNRAAAVLSSCILFLNNTLKEGVSESNISELLETLADALISLEYYLSEVETHKEANEKVLEVAEESLTALGYPVDSQ